MEERVILEKIGMNCDLEGDVLYLSFGSPHLCRLSFPDFS